MKFEKVKRSAIRMVRVLGSSVMNDQVPDCVMDQIMNDCKIFSDSW